MDTDRIKERFDLVASNYDSQRRKFIPCYDDYYLAMVNFIAQSFSEPKKVVDLGAGTGLLTSFFYQRYPQAQYTLIDISESMLEVAKERFDGIDTVLYRVSDYSNKLDIAEADLIISGLSIHHLSNDDKQKLYNDIFQKLPENGMFVNFDQFNAESAYVNELYNKFWYAQIVDSDLPKNEHEKWLKRRELDQENTIDETKQMLKNAGFAIVECIYSYMKFGVVIAQTKKA